MYKYSLENGSWYLKDGQGTIILMTDELAVAYDSETMTMLKHGDKELVQKYVDKMRKAGMLNTNILLFSKSSPVDEINNIVLNATYLSHFIKKFSTISLPPVYAFENNLTTPLFEKIKEKESEVALLGSQFSYDEDDQKYIQDSFEKATKELESLYAQLN